MSGETSAERPVVVRPRSAGDRIRRLIVSVVAIAVFVGMLTGCSLVGDVFQRKTTPAENHKYQRITAVNTKKEWPNIDVITFTREGSYAGSGTWAVNAVVRIDGKDYRQIIGPYSGVGEDMPLPVKGTPPSPLTVNYSDGSSEIIE